MSFCDVGDRDTEYLEITQRDGKLEVDLNDPISYYEGGVDSDGSMQMGGYATELGGSVELTALVTGDFDIDPDAEDPGWTDYPEKIGNRLIATATARMWGEVETGDETLLIDCAGEFELEGFWRYGLDE